MSENAVSKTGVVPQTFHFESEGCQVKARCYIIIPRSTWILCKLFTEIHRYKTHVDILGLQYLKKPL